MRAPWKFLKRAAFSIVFLFGYAAFTVITQPGLFRVDVDDPPTAGPTEYRLIANLHDIWLQRDRSRAAEAMQTLHYDHELVRVQALWTLACLECRESLPAVEKLEQDPAVRVRTYAQMTAARLKTIPDTPAKDFRELRRQMRAFLREVHLSTFQVAYYVRHPYARNHTAWHRAHYAIQQLEDMALAASQRGVFNAVSASPVNLGLDRGTKLKLKLSAMPVRQRISFLVETLAAKRVLKAEDRYLIQALINEGQPAAPVIIAKLGAMRQSPSAYLHAGYNALFSVLDGIGGPKATAVVNSFRTFKSSAVREYESGWIRYYAKQSYEDLSQGCRRNPMPTY